MVKINKFSWKKEWNKNLKNKQILNKEMKDIGKMNYVKEEIKQK